MELQNKMIFGTFMVMLICCQDLLATPLGDRLSSDELSEYLQNFVADGALSRERSPLTRHKRYIGMQIMEKLNRETHDEVRPRHPRYYRFFRRGSNTRVIHLKKQ